MAEPSFFERAACRGKPEELFFAPESKGVSLHYYDRGKTICRDCQVRLTCLEYALEHNEKFGLWGGVGPRERARMRQQRQRNRQETLTALRADRGVG
jgi:WhiB family redox-sensing transcriptional regulator